MSKINLKCPNCGAECHWVEEARTKVCLHCGYQEKSEETDAVKIEQLHLKAKLHEQRMSFLSKHFNIMLLVGLMVLCMAILGIMALLEH